MSRKKTVFINEVPETSATVYKQYQNLIYKIVNQYRGKSSLSFSELLSAANVGLLYAVSTYKNTTSQTLQKYIGWCVRNQILSDINSYSRTVRVSPYQQEKSKNAGIAFSTTSIDYNADGELINQSYYAALSEDPFNTDTDDTILDVVNIIEGKFSKKECEIFYKLFGVNGYAETEPKKITASYGMSASSISQLKSKMIKYIQANV